MVKVEASGASMRSRSEFCIDAFVQETGYVSATARPARRNDLSPQLGRLVARMTPATAWLAWIDGHRGWFVQGRICEPADEVSDRPTVYMVFHDLDAVPVTAGIWRRSAPAKWELMESLSYAGPYA